MTFDQAWAELVAGWYPGDPFQPTVAVRQYYETKWRIAEPLRPRSILEIGVRAGYSAFVLMRASRRGVRYLGIDNGLCDAEARQQYLAHAEKLLEGMDALIWNIDAWSLRALPAGPDGSAWDLVHVDGDHSYDGCLHDVRRAAMVGRRILVDDYDTGAEIRRACAEFLGSSAEWTSTHISDGGMAGNLLMVRK